MASSIQVVGKRIESLNDLDLLAVLGFLLEELEAEPSRYPVLLQQQAFWRNARMDSGPGTIDLGLSWIASTPSALEQFSQLLERVDDALSEFGPVVPASVLNARYRVRGVRFANFEISRLLATVQSIRRLLGILTS